MVEDIQVIPAVEQDIDALVGLINGAYRGESAKIGWTTESDLLEGNRTDPEMLMQLFQTKGHHLLKAIAADGEIIGCVSLQEKAPVLYLGMLTVRPDLQTKGIGKALMAAGESMAAQIGLIGIEMTVISQRSELIAYYQRRGYHVTGEKRAFPQDPRFGIQKQALEFIVLFKEC